MYLMIHTLSKFSGFGFFAFTITVAGLLLICTRLPYKDTLNIDYFLTFVNKKMKLMKKILKWRNLRKFAIFVLCICQKAANIN